jgi:hypothetical protein
MTRTGKILGGVAALAVVVLFLIAAFAIYRHHKKPISMWGAVLKQDADTRKQSPIAEVEITIPDFSPPVTAKSDFSGAFRLRLPAGIRRGQRVKIQFRHPGYEPLDLQEMVSDNLVIVRMTAVESEVDSVPADHPPVPVANVTIRYSIETTTSVNVGTDIATFQVVNKGNTPCHHRSPCSPDGKWKAAIGSGSLDAGEGNVLDDARISCIAGPCPFTRVVSDDFPHRTRKIDVSVLGWSDTTTFLLQAEVYRQEIGDIVRNSYPVIFGQSINFTLPPAAEGPTLIAEINNASVIFPLGPSPILSWANCNVRVEKDQSKTYRCELKPGYAFRLH